MNRIIGNIVLYWVKLKHIFQFTPHDITNVEGKSHERYRRILLTGGSTLIVKIFTVAINLITVPLTLNYLGAERYGLWMAISSVLALMGFADLGLRNGLLNAISKAHGRNSIEEAQTAVSSTFYILLGISCVLFLIFLSIFPFISWQGVFNVKSALAIRESGPTMMALVITLLINMPLGIIQRIQSGYQEGYKFQLWLILGSLFSFISLLICIFLKTSLTWLVIAYSGGQIIATLLNGIALFNGKRRYLKPRFKFFKIDIGKQLISSGFVFLLIGVFTLLANASDDIIIAQTLGPKAIAGYEIVKKLFLFSMFTQYIIQPLWPAFGEALESGDYAWASKTMQKVLKLSLVSGAVISLPFLLFGKQIVVFWVGKEFIPDWSLLFGFYIYVILNNYIGVMSTLLNSSKLVSKLILPIALTAITSILFKIILSLNIGVSGIIWATILGWSLFFAVPSYYLSKSIFK